MVANRVCIGLHAMDEIVGRSQILTFKLVSKTDTFRPYVLK